MIPNPWDPGSARYLKHLGFKALATTSAGFAFSRGMPDGTVSRDEMLLHITDLVNATDLPVNADFGPGFADEPELVADNVVLCSATGVAGVSVEDATGDEHRPLYDFTLAVERVKAAKAELLQAYPDVLLVARSECFLAGHPDPLKESLRRLEAFAAAGADVLYAPGLRTRDEIKAVVAAAGPKPVNVLASASLGLQVADLAELGVRRISVGSALARSAWDGFIRAATAMATEGSFQAIEPAVPHGELNRFFAEWR